MNFIHLQMSIELYSCRRKICKSKQLGNRIFSCCRISWGIDLPWQFLSCFIRQMNQRRKLAGLKTINKVEVKFWKKKHSIFHLCNILMYMKNSSFMKNAMILNKLFYFMYIITIKKYIMIPRIVVLFLFMTSLCLW